VPSTVVLADAVPTSHAIMQYARGNLLRSELSLMLRNIVRVQGKPLKEVRIHSQKYSLLHLKKVKLYFQISGHRLAIKFLPNILLYFKDLEGFFPTMKHTFIVRHPKTCLNSWYKMNEQEFVGPFFK